MAIQLWKWEHSKFVGKQAQAAVLRAAYPKGAAAPLRVNPAPTPAAAAQRANSSTYFWCTRLAQAPHKYAFAGYNPALV